MGGGNGYLIQSYVGGQGEGIMQHKHFFISAYLTLMDSF